MYENEITFISNQRIKGKLGKKWDEKKNTMYWNSPDAVKSFFRGKFIAINLFEKRNWKSIIFTSTFGNHKVN